MSPKKCDHGKVRGYQRNRSESKYEMLKYKHFSKMDAPPNIDLFVYGKVGVPEVNRMWIHTSSQGSLEQGQGFNKRP